MKTLFGTTQCQRHFSFYFIVFASGTAESGSKGKPPKSARQDNNARQQPKTQGPTPAPTPDTKKRRHDATKHPRPAEEAEAPTTTHPTAADPTTTTGKAHAKRGSGLSNYTQALYKNARRPCTKTRTVRRGAHEPQKEASLAIRKPCTETAMQTCAAHIKTLFDTLLVQIVY